MLQEATTSKTSKPAPKAKPEARVSEELLSARFQKFLRVFTGCVVAVVVAVAVWVWMWVWLLSLSLPLLVVGCCLLLSLFVAAAVALC